MGHVVLLGDSIFDTGVHVQGSPDLRLLRSDEKIAAAIARFAAGGREPAGASLVIAGPG